MKAGGRHTLLTILVLLGLSAIVTGQNNTIKGFIYDKETGQPVPLVNVVAEPGGHGALTNEEGYYLIHRLPEGEMTIRVFCIGYDTAWESVSLKKNMTLIRNFRLHPSSYELNEINITGARETTAQRRISEVRMLPAEIALTPSVGGMPDIIQHIQSMPGVVARGDIGGQVYIRGGTPVQTKVLLDEAVIYNPIHSIGLFSVFDNDYIRNADFYTGGFDAEYGGCLSSVIDISSKKPNPVNWAGKFDVSTIASKMTVEGPIVRDSTLENISLSVLLSLKTSYLEQTSEWFYPYLDQDLPFHFMDIYGKTSLQLGKSFNVSLSGFNFQDGVSETSGFKTYDWKSSGFSINMMTMPQEVPILIKTYLAGSWYEMELAEPNLENRFSKVSSITFGMKFYRYMNRQTVKYGLEFTDLRTTYRYFTNSFNDYEQGENSAELSGYLDYQGHFGRWVLEAGFRAAYYTSLLKFSPEPRVSIRFLALDNLAFKAAAGLYSQNLVGAVSDKDIVNFFQGYLSAPVDMVSTAGDDPSDMYLQKASHIVAGMEFDARNKLFLNVEAYYKNYTRLINFNKNKLFNENDVPGAPSYMTGTFVSETGFAEGVETSLRYQRDHYRLDANYSFAVVKRRYIGPNGEAIWYYPQYDRRHNLNLSGMYAFGRDASWMVTARWNYGTGFPFTPSAGYYEGVSFDEFGNINFLTQNGQMSIIYGLYNSKRLPAYQRLDVALEKTFVFRNRNTLETEISIINVYNQENIFYINRNTNEASYQLPILPSLRVSYVFP
jgi:hypothetical protein